MSIDHRQITDLAADALRQGCSWVEGSLGSDGRRSFELVDASGVHLIRLRMSDDDFKATAALFTGATPIPPPPPPPTPPPSTTGTQIGLVEQHQGTATMADTKACVNYCRVDHDQVGDTGVRNAIAAGLKVCLMIPGPYSSSGVSGLNATNWANGALSIYKNVGATKATVPWVEVLNEPEGSWFWGSNADSSTNAQAYATLVAKVYDTFHAALGSESPRIIASASAHNGWGKSWWSHFTDKSKVDALVTHPYGGTGARSSSALGDRASVTDLHTWSGKPVCCTEVGWPTATTQSPTGDSLQWSEADQATNIVNFANWAKGTGYVELVTFFCKYDFDTKDWYGVCHSSGAHKPAYAALHSVAT